MEVQLKELLEKIKSEGVESAQAEARKIVADAEKQAAEVAERAKQDAARIVEAARQDANRAQQSGEAALKQAARDMLLNVQAKLKALFQQLVNDAVSETFSPKVLEESVVALLSRWTSEPLSDLTVQIPAASLAKVESGLRSRLAAEITKGLAIEAAPGLDSGFRLVRKDGAAYYDFSAQSIADILGEYLNPRLANILRESIAKS